MANLCCCTMRISGPDKQLAVFIKDLKEQKESILSKNPYFTINNGHYGSDLNMASETSSEIEFEMYTKWDPKLSEISDVSEDYPELEFYVRFEEGAMDIYGEATIKNGCIAEKDMSGEEFFEKFNEDYAEKKEIIENAPWEEIKDMDFGFEPFYPITILEETFVKRIPEKELKGYEIDEWTCEEAKQIFKVRTMPLSDIPLHINDNWTEHAKEILKERLSKGK